MNVENRLKPIEERIQVIKQAARELKEIGGEFPALSRNSTRLLASIQMLEINVSDILDVTEPDG